MNYNRYKAFDLAYASLIRKEKTEEEIKQMDSTFKRIKTVKQTFGLFLKDDYINSKNKNIINFNKIINPDNSSLSFLRGYDVHVFEKDDYSAVVLGELNEYSSIIIYKKVYTSYKVLYFNFPDTDEFKNISFDNHERIKQKEVHDKEMLEVNIKKKNEFILEVIYAFENMKVNS